MAYSHSYGIVCRGLHYTVVRTDAGLRESFEVKVGLHQGFVLSPLWFAVVMDLEQMLGFVKVSK